MGSIGLTNLSAPEPLSASHQLDLFDCGNATLNDWLKKRAIRNQKEGASRSFVVCNRQQVVAYYALASGSVERTIAPKAIARNMPEPIPVMVLGRLAVDQAYQGMQLGSLMLRDALLRVVNVSRQVGIRALLVRAISEDAKRFYQQYGFQSSPIDSMTLFLSIKTIQQSCA